MIVKCSKCQTEMKAPESLYGGRGKCPKCGGPVDIPEHAPDDQRQDITADEEVMENRRDGEASGPWRPAFCQSCGEELPLGAVFCRKCGHKAEEERAAEHESDEAEAQHGAGGGLAPSEAAVREAETPGPAPGFEELAARGALVRPPEYPEKFNPRGFCWPAFWFGFFWYFFKGMTAKGLVLTAMTLALLFLTVGAGLIVMPPLLGFMGYRDYSRFYSTKKQFWW